MANKTIHELNSIATLNSGDELAIYDVNGSTTGKGTIADITDIAVKKSISSLGIKNLILYPYYDNTELENGITWTDNGDGTITANGTATATSYHTLWRSVQGKFPNITSGQRYILSLEVQNGTCSIYFAHYLNSINKGEVTLREISNRYAEIEFTAWEDEYDSNALGLYIGASSAYGTLVNTTIKPMLRLASDTDNTWQPYIATNTTLTKQIGTTNIASIDDGTITGAISVLNNDLDTLSNKIITKSKRVTFNAIANNTVDLGIIKTLFSFQDPAYLASLIAVIPQGVDTTIFNNHVELLMFVNSTGLHLYVKTYKAANNVSLDLYGVIFTS